LDSDPSPLDGSKDPSFEEAGGAATEFDSQIGMADVSGMGWDGMVWYKMGWDGMCIRWGRDEMQPRAET